MSGSWRIGLLGALSLTVVDCSGGASDSEPAKAGESGAIDEADFGDQRAWARSQGLELREFDLNRDQKPNVFKFFKTDEQGAELIVRKDTDLNNDGRVDIVQLYNEKGELVSERSDLDFDGRIDIIAYYEGGVLTHKELDLNYDGRADITRYYEKGQVDRIETDNNGDGRVDTWEYFANGELDRVGTDNDGDGIVDHWDRRNQPEEVQGTEDASSEEVPNEEAPDAENSSDV